MQKIILSTILLLFVYPGAQAASLDPFFSSSERYEDIRVARVQAVDRILLENDKKVALIGIKGPRAPRREEVNYDKYGRIILDDDPTTPFAVEAMRFACALAEGKPVRLEFDTTRRDSDGNMLAYVFLPDGKMLNAELVRNGYADLKLVPPNMKHADELRAAYQEARREKRGMQGDL